MTTNQFFHPNLKSEESIRAVSGMQEFSNESLSNKSITSSQHKQDALAFEQAINGLKGISPIDYVANWNNRNKYSAPAKTAIAGEVLLLPVHTRTDKPGLKRSA